MSFSVAKARTDGLAPAGSSSTRAAARIGSAAFILLTVALLAVAVHALRDDAILWHARIAALVVAVVLGLTRAHLAAIAFVATAPLLGAISRASETPGLSLAEHALFGLAAATALRAAGGRGQRAPTAVDQPLAAWVAVVTVLALTGLAQYPTAELSWAARLIRALERHLTYTIWHFAQGDFLVVHEALVWIEGGLCFLVLTVPALRLEARHLRGALVAAGLLVAAAAVVQSGLRVGGVGFFQETQPGLFRVNATLPDPNTFAAFLVLVFPLVLTTVCARRAPVAAAATGAVLGFGLVASVSRTAWVAAAVVALATVALLGWRPHVLGVAAPAALRRWCRVSVVAVLLAGGGALVTVTAADLGRDVGYRTARSPADMLLFSLNLRRPMGELLPRRAEHWDAALAIWRDAPLTGAGVGKYPLLKNRYRPESRERWLFFTDAHNYYLKILAETGLIGLALFLVLLAAVGRQVRLAWQAGDPATRGRVAAIGAGLAGFLVCSLNEDPLALREIQYVFWAMVALVVLELRERTGASATPPRPAP